MSELIEYLKKRERLKWRIVDNSTPGILKTYHQEHGHGMWGLCTLRKHAGDECILCGERCEKRAFRPMSNKRYRMLRICHRHQ